MKAMIATDKAVEVELLGEREFFCNGEPFDMKNYRNLSPEDQKYLDRVADDVYDLPVFEDGYVTAHYNKFSVRIKAKLVER